jgi:AcrR family transcriptional regulator
VPSATPRERDPRSLFFRHLPEGWELDRTLAARAQRERMLDAMARAVAAKGYASVTVTDVVSLAGVSRSTFYEHFDDRDECFLATFQAGAQALGAAVAEAVVALGDAGDWHERVRAGIERYTQVLAENPDATHALLIHGTAAGPRAAELRRNARAGFVALFRGAPDGDKVPEAYFVALVGAISELVQSQILTEGPETLPELAPTLIEIAFSMVELGARSAVSGER